MQVSIKIEGIPDLQNKLRQLGPRVITEAFLPTAEEGMKLIGNDWWTNLREHHQTGHFEESIKERIDGKGGTYVVAHVGALDADKDTAIGINALEYGHINRNGSHTPAYPTGRPAIEKNKKVFKRIAEDKIRRLFK